MKISTGLIGVGKRRQASLVQEMIHLDDGFLRWGQVTALSL